VRIVVCNRLTEYLGVEIISAILKKQGHTVTLIFEPDILAAAFVRSLPGALSTRLDSAHRAARRVLALSPELVLFPSEINSFLWCAQVGELIKKERQDIHLLHGGFHATSSPEECITKAGVDMLCVGEGDLAIPELVSALAEGRDVTCIANIWVKDREGTVHRNSPRALVQDLDSLPWPDKSLYYDEMPGLAREYMCVTSRGCHWACSFCFYTTLYSLYGREGYLRARSPQHVIGELVAAKERWDLKYVVFHDDIFPTSIRWLREFAPLYRDQVGLPFSCITHPQLILEESAALLASMNCRYVIMGAQTVNEDSRSAEVINRTETSEDIRVAVARLKLHGIFVLLDHIFGIPGEDLEDQEKALQFYIETGADVIKPFFMSYFPGTDLSRRAQQEQGRSDSEPRVDQEQQWDHFMFEGELSGDDFRAYNLAYALFPLLTERGRMTMLRLGLHHRLAPLSGLPGMGNLILIPRLISGLIGDRDIRPKLYLNYLKTIGKYRLRKSIT
jgi:anaerobic magnesium-protoporphyrin IX monomethyl ester cyclase